MQFVKLFTDLREAERSLLKRSWSRVFERLLVRRAEPGDVQAIVALSRSLAAYLRDPDPGASADELLDAGFQAEPWCECHVALMSGHIVGFVMFSRRFEAHTRERSLWIGDLFTSNTVRGHGVGKALIDAVHHRARQLAAASIVFDVWTHNQNAVEFYTHLGAHVLDDRNQFRFSLETPAT